MSCEGHEYDQGRISSSGDWYGVVGSNSPTSVEVDWVTCASCSLRRHPEVPVCPCATGDLWVNQSLYGEAIEALKAMEFSRMEGGFRVTIPCPWCHRRFNDGHADDCAIGNAIKKAEGTE